MAPPRQLTSDILIIGGGHNGLVCAAYLADAGLKVTVLERATLWVVRPSRRNFIRLSQLGGRLHRLAFSIPRSVAISICPATACRSSSAHLPTSCRLQTVVISASAKASPNAKSPSSPRRDVARLAEYGERLELIADVLRGMILEAPPNVVAGSWRQALPEVLRAARLGGRMSKLSLQMRRQLLTLFASSAGHMLDHWFESDPIKAVLGFDSITGTYGSPYSPGSAYVLLHHVFGEVNGKKGAWGHPIGGMGAITQAMAKAALQRGVDIRLDSGVSQVLIDNGRAVGAVTESGEVFRATAVVSNLNPKLLYLKLIDAAALPKDFLEHISQWRCGSGTFRMNVALSELPDFTCLPGRTLAPHHTSGIILAPSLRYMEQAYFDARAHGWARQPIVEICIPSTLDNTLAPPGQHVASLYCQHVAPQLPNGELLGRASRHGRGPNDRYGQPICAEFQIIRARTPDHEPAGSGTDVWPCGRRYFSWAVEPRSALLRAADAGLRQLPRSVARSLHVRGGHSSRWWRHRRSRP